MRKLWIMKTVMHEHETPLRRVRRRLGRKLSDVAKAIDFDAGSLSRVERGLQTAMPDVAEKLARYYGGEISEMEILYPERYVRVVQKSNDSHSQ